MNHDLYIFGSAVRGEISSSSDIDVLAIPLDSFRGEYPSSWSVYSPELIQSYFQTGRLFAWHLYLEAKCIYSAGSLPFLQSLGSPAPYSSVSKDIDDLEALLQESLEELRHQTTNLVYELGIAYTAIRDIAMSASWKLMARPCFSRNAPYLLTKTFPLSSEAYKGIMLARHSSTRGNDYDIDYESIAEMLLKTPILSWVKEIKHLI